MRKDEREREYDKLFNERVGVDFVIGSVNMIWQWESQFEDKEDLMTRQAVSKRVLQTFLSEPDIMLST